MKIRKRFLCLVVIAVVFVLWSLYEQQTVQIGQGERRPRALSNSPHTQPGAARQKLRAGNKDLNAFEESEWNQQIGNWYHNKPPPEAKKAAVVKPEATMAAVVQPAAKNTTAVTCMYVPDKRHSASRKLNEVSVTTKEACCLACRQYSSCIVSVFFISKKKCILKGRNHATGSRAEPMVLDGFNSYRGAVTCLPTNGIMIARQQLCNHHGLEPLSASVTPRRMFLGSLIAEDSWNVLSAVSAEAESIYHAVVFVESTTTQAMFARDMRFTAGSGNLTRLKTLWEPTKVVVDSWRGGPGTPSGCLAREQLQRQQIIHQWKKLGMKPEDIGIVADADETFTRGV